MPKVKEHRRREHKEDQRERTEDMLKTVDPNLNLICERNDVNNNQKLVFQSGKQQSFCAWKNFIWQQNKEFLSIKKTNKSAKENMLILNKTLCEKTEEIAGFQKHYKDMEVDLQACKSELEQLRKENQLLLEQNIVTTEKFTNLEVNYEKELLNLLSTVSKKEEEIKTHQKQNLCVMEEFEKYRQKCESNLVEQSQIIENIKCQLNEKERELQELREQKQTLTEINNSDKQKYESEMVLLKQNWETEINLLKLDLEKKDKAVAECLQEKVELEREKNKTIDELTFKIRKIEKVFGQPVKSITPVINNSSDREETNIKSNESRVALGNKKEISPMVQLTYSNQISNPEKTNRSNSDDKVNNQKILSGFAQANPRRRKLPTRYVPSSNEFESENNSDEDWAPKSMTSLLPKNGNSSKRSLRDNLHEEIIIPSESSAFDRLKRSKISK